MAWRSMRIAAAPAPTKWFTIRKPLSTKNRSTPSQPLAHSMASGPPAGAPNAACAATDQWRSNTSMIATARKASSTGYRPGAPAGSMFQRRGGGMARLRQRQRGLHRALAQLPDQRIDDVVVEVESLIGDDDHRHHSVAGQIAARHFERAVQDGRQRQAGEQVNRPVALLAEPGNRQPLAVQSPLVLVGVE